MPEQQRRPAARMIVTTLATASHLPQAVVALESIRAHNPAVDESILLLIDAHVSNEWQARHGVRVIGIDDLGDVERLGRMRRYYSVFEFCNAVKPWLHRFVSSNTGADRWLYVDADTWCRGPLTALFERQGEASIVVTQHSASPGTSLVDIRRDLGLCGFGTVNGGVVSIRRSPTADDFIAWWQARLVGHCRDNVAEGEYVDQRWLDVALGCFPGLRADRIAGVNIGHWNLHELTLRDGELFDRDGEPCALVHFSQVRVTGAGADFSQFPGAGPAADAFRRLGVEWAAEVAACAARIGEGVMPDATPAGPLPAIDRDIVVQAVRRASDEGAAFESAMASLERTRRRRALREMQHGARSVWRGLRALLHLPVT